jgi:hypothetical protein
MSRTGDGHYVTPRDDSGLMAVTMKAVCANGGQITDIADRLGVSRWTIGRLLRGELELTPEWSQAIICASEEIAQISTAE